MKEPIRSIAVLCALTLLFAFGCKKENTENTDTASTSVAASDTSTTTSAMSGTTGTSTAAAPQLSDDDQKFVQKAALGGLAEVSLGQRVAPGAKNSDVKGFAERMVSDHSKANDELTQLASTKGITLPSQTDQEHQDAAAKVMSAKNVEKAYMEAMVKDHDKDVGEFEDESKAAKDPDLKAWIDKTLPVLKEHQKMAHDINGKMK